MGTYIAEALLGTGKHQVTAITRKDSTSPPPNGVTVTEVDYEDHSSLVKALKGHDALIITIAITAQAQQERLIRAAADAECPWILPNEWGWDSSNKTIPTALGMAEHFGATNKLIADLGKSSYINVSTGFWYEWSLPFLDAFGFDFDNKKLTIFDKGETRAQCSSWPQVGRAVVGLLSLKIKPDGPDDKEPCLEQFKNTWIYPTSFHVSQNEMLASVLRVTGASSDDWTITHEPTKERYEAAIQAMRAGDRSAFVKAMYTRAFYSDEPANVERWRGGSHNKVLGLREEDLDECTKDGIARVAEMNAWTKSIRS